MAELALPTVTSECPVCGRRSFTQDRFCARCGRLVRSLDGPTRTLGGPESLQGSTSLQEPGSSSLGPVSAAGFAPLEEPESLYELRISREGAGSMSGDETRDMLQILPGGRFAERFLVKERLGGGAMGLVFKVEDRRTGSPYALKVLRPEFSMDRAARARFEREIRILAKLCHPSIPRVVEWGCHQDLMFFVSRLVTGENLAEVLLQRGKLAISESVSLVVSVAEALHSAHQARVIHRDLKPGNIMVSKGGEIFLIDFGIAKSVRADWTKLTKTGHFVGTPQYMAPEQLRGLPIDERSDIYSLGVVFFALLTGQLPHCGRTPLKIAIEVMNKEPRAPRSLRPAIPSYLERIVLRCLAKDPKDRYQSLADLMAHLRYGDIHERRLAASGPARMPANGDRVVTTLDARRGRCLRIESSHERLDWTSTMALLYDNAFYRLAARHRMPLDRGWEYRFEAWPEGHDIRRVVDYEEEARI